MYECFEFDLENASFEWNEEKERINFRKTASILLRLQRFSSTPTSSYARMKSIRRRFGMTSSARWAKYCLWSAPSAKAMWFD